KSVPRALMPAWPHGRGLEWNDYSAGERSGWAFKLSVIDGAGRGAGAADDSGAACGGTGVMMIGSAARGGGSAGETSDTVTIGAGIAAPREHVARSRT